MGEARVYDVADGRVTRHIPIDRFGALAFVPGQPWLLRSDPSRVVELLSADSARVVRTFGQAQPHDGMMQSLLAPTAAAPSPDGRTVATTRWDEAIRVWDLQTGALLHTLPGRMRAVWSPDGRLLVGWVGRFGKRVNELRATVWEVATGREVASVNTRGRVGFTPDGRHLVGVVDGLPKVWSTSDGRLLASGADKHQGACFAISPDGRRVATAGRAPRIVIWSLETLPPSTRRP